MLAFEGLVSVFELASTVVSGPGHALGQHFDADLFLFVHFALFVEELGFFEGRRVVAGVGCL